MGGSSTAECGNNWTSKLPLCSFTYFSRMFLTEYKQTVVIYQVLNLEDETSRVLEQGLFVFFLKTV